MLSQESQRASHTQDGRQGGCVPTGDLPERVSWDKKAVNRTTMGEGCSVVQCVTTLPYV